MDVPRLSTLQAMLLILKARESSPKRGYYFRSWMTVVTLIEMAKELELDEHHSLHQQGVSCGSTYHDCVTKTRVWQTLFICELMVGAPQGEFQGRCQGFGRPWLIVLPKDVAICPSTSTRSISPWRNPRLVWTSLTYASPEIGYSSVE